jgi:hypothetical protein
MHATNQQYFSLRTNQTPATSTFLSEQTSTSHEPPTNPTRWQLTTTPSFNGFADPKNHGMEGHLNG